MEWDRNLIKVNTVPIDFEKQFYLNLKVMWDLRIGSGWFSEKNIN